MHTNGFNGATNATPVHAHTSDTLCDCQALDADLIAGNMTGDDRPDDPAAPLTPAETARRHLPWHRVLCLCCSGPTHSSVGVHTRKCCSGVILLLRKSQGWGL